MLKDVLKQIIILHQDEMPYEMKPRDVRLPLASKKIITVPGVRRCGKSSMLQLAINDLLSGGLSSRNVLWVGFDDERLAGLNVNDLDLVLEAYRELYPQTDLKQVYMFFDEIQIVEGWELFVMRVHKSYCPNIFISGSNAKLLSKDIASALRGWSLEYDTYPLSFQEYCRFTGVEMERLDEQKSTLLRMAWDAYNRDGGFPEVVLTHERSLRDKLLQSYFNAMLFRDLVERYAISNIGVLRYFVKRLMNNVTKPTSINNLYNDIRSQGLKVSKDELYRWANYVCDSFMFLRIPRYTPSLVEEAHALKKYYFIDNGMRQSVLLPQSHDDGKLLETNVMLHLTRRCGDLDKVTYFQGQKECDFVVQREDNVAQLVQATWSLADKETRQREIDGLLEAAHSTRCDRLTIVTHHEEEILEQDGFSIRVVPAWKWMLE